MSWLLSHKQNNLCLGDAYLVLSVPSAPSFPACRIVRSLQQAGHRAQVCGRRKSGNLAPAVFRCQRYHSAALWPWTSSLSASVSLSKQCNIPSLVVVPMNWCMQSAWPQCLAPRKHPVSVRLIPVEAGEGGESCPGSSSFPRVVLLLLQLSPPWLSIFLCRL